MKFWSSLSPFTRGLAIIVLVSSALVIYGKQRLLPLRDELRQQRKEIVALERDVRQARDRVRELQNETVNAQRWAGYALILDRQSSGRSLRDILSTCGTQDGPQLAVQDLRFQRLPRAHGFGRIAASFELRGRYPQLLRLLHELDTAFPPIEITRTDLAVLSDQDRGPQSGVAARDGMIRASLEGVIYEPR